MSQHTLEQFEKMLAEVNCHPRSFLGTRMFRCPACSHTRKKKHVRCLSVKSDANGFMLNCHHCGFQGGAFYRDRREFSDHKHLQQKNERAVQRMYR